MTYKSEQNKRRAERGYRAIELHGDLPGSIDIETAASDMIANILHALNERGLPVESTWEKAWDTYLGDFEDEPAPCGLL